MNWSTRLITAAIMPFIALTAMAKPPVKTCSHVDLQRYQGLWYETANSENSNQKSKERLWHKEILWGKNDSPVGTTVFYELKNGKICLTNKCYQNSFSGKLQKITGVAIPTDSSNSKLKVKFDPLVLRPFSFDYWIIDVDPDYKLALLGTPDRKSLSILSRTPKPDQELLDKALQKASEEGFDPKMLKSIPQQNTN